jgi:tetratricopeptide (TPR) repeat protein
MALTLLTGSGLMLGCAWFALFGSGPAHAGETADAAGDGMFFNARYLEAQLLLAAGRTDQARTTLESCRKAAACPDFIYQALARTYATEGKLKEAQGALDEGLKRHPQSVNLLVVRASLKREAGSVIEAMDDLERALKTAPHRQDVLEMLSELHLSRLISNPAGSDEEIGKLIDVYNQMLTSRRGNERLVPLLVLSTLYQKIGQVEKAVEVSKEALSINSRSTRVFETHASALVAAKRYDEALKTYRRALVIAPDDEDLRHKVEALLLEQGGEDRRARFFIELAADYPDNAGIQQAAARVLMGAKRWPEAESCLRALLRKRPEDIPNKLALLHVWMEMGKVQDVVAEAKRLGRASGDLAPAITLSVAEALESQGRRREAISLLEDYNANHPLNENVALGLVALLIESDQQEKAAGLLEKIKAQAPGNFIAIALLAEVYAYRERFDDAHNLLNALPESVRTQHAADVALLRSGLYINQSAKLKNGNDQARALTLLDQALALLSGMPQADRPQDRQKVLDLRTAVWLQRGLIHQKRGDQTAAEAAYRQAMDLNPGDAETWNTLGYFYAQTNQKLDEAQRLIQKALELKPKAPHILDSLGWVLFRQGRYQDAVAQLEKAARDMGDQPDTAEVYDHLGDAYAKVGRVENARQAWNKALQLKSDLDPGPIRKKLERAGK